MLEQEPAATTRDVEVPQPESSAPTRVVTTNGASLGSLQRNLRPLIGPVKILFVSASPGDKDQLVVDEEYRAIEQRIRKARHRDAFRLIALLAARRGDLQDALLEHAPHIVHFACHGSRDAAVYLLRELHNDLVLVVFNACFASTQASAVRTFARAAIGMRSHVTDRASIMFASALYGALAYGRSVQEAFDLGVAALDAPENKIPELFERTLADARKLHLVGRRWRRGVLLVTSAVCSVVVAALAVVRGPPARPAPDQPFVLDTRLRVHRSQGTRSVNLDELRSGDVVMDGDRLQLSARTSSDGYLYLAFCSQRTQVPGIPELSVFPEQGEIRLIANQTTSVPAKLVVDNHPGLETLYLIVSRQELSQSDARLAEVLAIARRERSATECGAQFRGAIGGPRGRPASNGHSSAALQDAQRDESHREAHIAIPSHNKPTVTRGFEAVWDDAQPGVNADADGVVVLRYEFTHVPRPPVLASEPL